MGATSLNHIFHLYSRLGFGITYAEAKKLTQNSLPQIINSLFITSVVQQPLNEIKENEVPLNAMSSGMNKKDFQKLINSKLKDLNISWIKKLQTTEHVLLEKQTLFWHNHFACRIRNPYLMQELNNIHRKFAFGSFRDMLVEVSKSPAMILYLNNQQNKKQHPNENFAREVMELFTLGRGNYTETDIKEAARAFTGWGVNKQTQHFEFNEKHHDFDEKQIFNRTGNFGGEDVINMIISNKQTAYFITKKLYKYYVNETVNEEHVKELADYYYQNQYNTGALIKKIVSSNWFYDSENMGCNIKSPIEYLVGLTRQFSISYSNYTILIQLQRALGMQLFFPPNVAGWPGGKSFIDNSTLLLRMKLPSVILNNGELEVPDNIDDPDDQSKKDISINNKMDTEVNWTNLIDKHKNLTLENLLDIFLQKKPSEAVVNTIKNNTTLSTKEIILKIVSLPEYSLS